MSYLTQKTIKSEVSFNGIALHSGVNVNVSIKPAEPNFGIVFKRIDLKSNNLVYPNFNNVTNMGEILRGSFNYVLKNYECY